VSFRGSATFGGFFGGASEAITHGILLELMNSRFEAATDGRAAAAELGERNLDENPLLVDQYARAIERHVMPNMVVAVLGSGSGILACLAARRGAKVYAIGEPSTPRQVRPEAPGMANIHFIEEHSRAFQPLEKIDLLLHGHSARALLDHTTVEELLDLKKRILKSGGSILPQELSLFIDPVEVCGVQSAPQSRKPREFRASCFKPLSPVTGDGSRPVDLGAVKRLATDQCVLHLDLKHLPPVQTRDDWECNAARIALSGRLDGFFMHLKMRFDEASKPTGPDAGLCATDPLWFHCEAREVSAGALLHFQNCPGDRGAAPELAWEYALLESGDLRMR
jgi:type I protein arginine methyltransferase